MDEEKKKENKLKKILQNQSFRTTILLFVMVVLFLLMVVGGITILLRPYTITIDLNDGSEPMTETYTVNSGAINLGIPTRAGYHFTGWTGSNGSKPNRNVTVGNGQLGDLSYVANWSDDLEVTCQDWIVDKNGTMIREITDEVDKFLKGGGSGKKYGVQERTIKVKPGTKVNATKWGEDRDYKAYSDQYIYVGSSGEVTVNEDEITVYRYFNPIVDVNYTINGQSLGGLEIKNKDVAFFDFYIDGNIKSADVNDYCGPVPYGSEYEVVFKNINPDYVVADDTAASGRGADVRVAANIDFTYRSGEVEVTCEDWLIDRYGNKVKEITDEVDKYLGDTENSRKYALLERTVLFEEGEEVSGALWGSDESGGAYSDKYVYVSASDVVVGSSPETVYRYFYPLLDINAIVNNEVTVNTNNLARFKVYVDNMLVGDDVTDFYGGVPCGSDYRIEITEYINWSYVHNRSYVDDGTMGDYKKEVRLRFDDREGGAYVIVEDWIVDNAGNRIKNITEEVDAFLSAGKSRQKYTVQQRLFKARVGDTIDPKLFGNDDSIRSYEDAYVYAGASEKVTLEEGTTTIYRYFYPVLDVNGLIIETNAKTEETIEQGVGNTSGIATFSVYVDGRLKKYRAEDFYDGVPYGSEYEVKVLETGIGYELVEDDYSGTMEKDAVSLSLQFNKTE